MKEMIRLAFPVAIGYLGLMTLGLVDLLAVGSLGPEATGAVGLGNSLFAWGLVFGLGLLSSMDHLVAKAYAQRHPRIAIRYLDQAMWLSIYVSVPVMLALGYVCEHLGWFGIPPHVAEPTRKFTQVLLWSLPGSLIFAACRNFLQAVGIATGPMLVLVFANALNIFLNYGFVHGNWGMPNLGVPGTALATVICRTSMAAIAYWMVRRWAIQHLGRAYRERKRSVDRELMHPMLRLGFPSASQMLVEIGVFSTTTTLAARLPTHALAAHQIVLNIIGLTFMVPLGIGAASAILVSHAVGKKNVAEARRMGRDGLLLGASFMALTCVTLLCFAPPILGIYSTDAEVIAVGLQVLFVAALFQLADGVQAVLTGALRGLADTSSPLYANLVGHWVIGLPIGIYLCFFRGFGLWGMWVGLALGLGTVATSLLAVWHRRSSVANLKKLFTLLQKTEP